MEVKLDARREWYLVRMTRSEEDLVVRRLPEKMEWVKIKMKDWM
jgi:hypothetical protein